ncbi:MAG TPA: hypothetical protein DCL38_04215, partial [Lachnospiraceae bacterium]|nr:hypothetical protein [Lachnospiraceae bacterium]
MRKALIPACLVAILTMLGFYLIANEYRRTGIKKGQSDLEYAGSLSEDTYGDAEGAEYPGQQPYGELTEGAAENGSLTFFTGVLVAADHEGRFLTLKDPGSDKEAFFSYDGTTEFLNRFGEGITAREVEPGEVLNAAFSAEDNALKRVEKSNEIWTLSGVRDFEADEKKNILTIAGRAYRFTEDLFICSEGEQAEWMDLTGLDTLTVRGLDRDIYSIVVEKGHGYIRLTNDSYFVGGYIEIRNKGAGEAYAEGSVSGEGTDGRTEMIRQITEDMLLPVPEGELNVRLTNKGYLGQEDLTVVRNKETILDLGKIKIEEVAIGHVEFNIEPGYAQLFIDGELTDYEERVPLEYGIHNIKLEAAGYEPVTTSLKIGSEYANVDIEMDKLPEEGQQGSSGSPFSGTRTLSDTYTGSSSGSSSAPPQISSASSTQGSTGSTSQGIPGSSSLSGTGSSAQSVTIPGI